MAPDYDLSNLHADQAVLWFYLKADAILAEIFADQPEPRTSPLALWTPAQCCGLHCAAAVGTQQRKTGGTPIGVGLGNEKVN